MAIKTILFDLDGTLLPMNQEVFVKEYFTALVEKLALYGYEPKQLMQTVYNGVAAMVKNDGTCKNEQAFWRVFSSVYGEKAEEQEKLFIDFYANDFQKAKKCCGFNKQAKNIVDFCKNKGLRVVLATNPLFPSIATESRMQWAGLEKEDFDFFTVYENSTYCKPNHKYYQEILQKISANANECLMVGNDIDEDMVAKTLGMQVFLLTDNLINKRNEDISKYPNGSFEQLKEWIELNI